MEVLNLDNLKFSNIEHIDLRNSKSDELNIANNSNILKVSMDSGDSINFNSADISYDIDSTEDIILGTSGADSFILSNKNELIYNDEGADTFIWTKLDSTRSDSTISQDTIIKFTSDDTLDLRELVLVTEDNIDDLIIITPSNGNNKIEIKEFSNSTSFIETIILKNSSLTSDEIKSQILVNKIY